MPDNTPDKSVYQKIVESLVLGGAATVLTAPLIDPFNRASVTASRYDLSGKPLLQKIYSGEANGNNYRLKAPSLLNFFAGLRPHLVKESSRLGFKAPGLAVYMPWLQANFPAHIAAQLYAISMAILEGFIQPFDTWRVLEQSGDCLVKKQWYAGWKLSVAKQYGVWATVMYNNMLFDPVMKENKIDPYGLKGILIKAYPQATINVAAVYVLERVKNELQFGILPPNSGIREAVASISARQGLQGFYRGCLIKTPGAAIQHAAALYVMSLGQART